MGQSLSKLMVNGMLGGFPEGAVIGAARAGDRGVRAARAEDEAALLGGAGLVGEHDASVMLSPAWTLAMISSCMVAVASRWWAVATETDAGNLARRKGVGSGR